MNGVEAYPLQWPAGWKRTDKWRLSESKFGKRSFGKIRDELFRELNLAGAQYLTLSTNLELRLDGIPYASRRQPDDTGAAVYFQRKGKPIVLACDKWVKIEENIRAIAKHIEALRGQERWGVGSLDRAFEGYKALPPPSDNSDLDPWEVLGLDAGASEQAVKRKYKELALVHHPDKNGGDSVFWNKINQAYQKIRG